MRHVLVPALSVVLLCGAAAVPPGGGAGARVCPELDTGRIDTTGDPLTVTVTAPEGYALGEVCVKAGSAQQGNGPELLVPDPGTTSLIVGHSSGKAVSHWSARFVPLPDDPVLPDDTPEPEETLEPVPVPEPPSAAPTTDAPAAPAAQPIRQAPAFTG